MRILIKTFGWSCSSLRLKKEEEFFKIYTHRRHFLFNDNKHTISIYFAIEKVGIVQLDIFIT